MTNDIKEILDRLDRIEKKMEGHCPINCRIDFDLKLRPMRPPSTMEDMRIQQMEMWLKAEIHKDLKGIENKINSYLRYL